MPFFSTVHLYTILPTGFFPQTDEGRMFGNIRGDQTASFDTMKPKFLKFMEIIQADPAVKTVDGYLGGGGGAAVALPASSRSPSSPMPSAAMSQARKSARACCPS